MQAEQLWLLLLNLARQMDIRVRLENLDQPDLSFNSGGLCLVNGRKVVFIDKRLPPRAQARQLGLCLLTQDVEQFHMLPAVRCFLDDLEGESGQSY